ncbi:MAG: glycine zipper 2TM domain-containing protein [Parvibaculaceae bacterium]|nr:glycine zipper 2TM domain-containing protein [Parvibaculaceae bacterium]
MSEFTRGQRRSPAKIIGRCAIVSMLMIAPLGLASCGTVVGAGAGGLVGNQFGKGNGKTAATIGGAVVGGVLGHAVTGD